MFKFYRQSNISQKSNLRILHDETGAVTVDWVVLSAFLVVVGAIVIGMYRGGVYSVASSISDAVVRSAGNGS